MNKEEIKKMIADDFDNFINERLDGAIIFKYISNLEKENLKLKEQLQQKEEVIKQLLTYLDKNKLTLNNPNILDFYINVKKILNIEKSDK